jgi:hypothetical protein
MKSAIAILTYRRLHALQETLAGLNKFCPQYPTAIFEDCGQSDGTETFLGARTAPGLAPACHKVPELLAAEWLGPIGTRAFLGDVNLGVAGNSNRAIRWFETMTDCDHLCLLNDDLHVLGDFVNFYAKAHTDLGVGMFSFCDFTHDASYRWLTVSSRGYRVKICPRMTGIMMSFTRPVVERIGYFDARFGKFGQEHCDYMNRARIAHFLDLDGQMQPQLDLESKPPVLKHQEVETSIVGTERLLADQEANRLIQEIGARYGQDPIYRPFALRLPKMASGHAGVGIPVDNLGHYKLLDVPA